MAAAAAAAALLCSAPLRATAVFNGHGPSGGACGCMHTVQEGVDLDVTGEKRQEIKM